MIHVELDIFSGRPNPRWSLDPAEEGELVARLLDRSVPLAPVDLVDGQLGYRGFVVRATGATAATLTRHGLPTAFRVRDGLASSIDAASESWLLATGEAAPLPALPAPVRRVAEAGSAVAAKCRKPYHTSSIDFSYWNGGLEQYQNNCYNYGSNWRTYTYAQPGRGSGTGLAAITIPEVLRCALSDGYLDHCKGKRNRSIKVWFCVWPGVDYHWYRQTEPMGGAERWCHKMGTGPAENKDDSGQLISDPRIADRGPYVDLGDFLFYPKRSNKTVV